MAQKKFVDTGGLQAALQGVWDKTKVELDKKPEKDGYYESMGVGVADNLAGRADDAVPAEIVFRPSGGTADIADGTATVTEFNGKTVVWNQSADMSSITALGSASATQNADGSWHISNTSWSSNTIRVECISFPTGHKFFIRFYTKAESIIKYVKFTKNSSVGHSGDTILPNKDLSSGIIRVQNVNISSDGAIYFTLAEGTECDLVGINIIDLTQMFGAGNEPATVEEFESMFPLPYYDYNEGELVSFNGTAIKSVGFNAYNPATGKAEVVGGNVYQITGTYTSITLDGVAITPDSDGHFTPSHDGELVVVGGNNVDTCIHLSHSGYRDGEYEPYWTDERELPVSKINTDGTITDSSTGKTRLFPNGLLSAGSVKDSITRYGAVKRLGIVNMGDLTWGYSANGIFVATISDRKYDRINLITPYYNYAEGSDTIIPDKSIKCYTATNIGIKDSSYTDAAAFKTAMSGVYLYYELATPIEVTFAEPLNLSYKVSDFGTEQLLPVNGSEPVTTPFNGEIAYGINAVDTLRNLSKNYISKESFTNFTSALGTSLGKTIAMTWNASTGEYDFTITDNPTTIE